MGRPKKNSTESIVAAVNEFYLEHNGDVSKLTPAEIGRYAEAKGYSIKAYDIRRDPRAMKRIDELSKDRTKEEEVITAYRNTDPLALIRSSKDLNELVGKIQQLDGYWREVDRQNSELRKELAAQESQKDLMSKREEEWGLKLEDLMTENKELSDRLRQAKKEKEVLSRLFKKHVYPAVSRELLRQGGLPVATSVTIECNAFSSLIASETPERFPGIQGREPGARKPKDEMILEELRKEAAKVGKDET